MAEPLYVQIFAAVKARVESIVGDGGTTYWYSPHGVVVHPALTGECLNENLGGAGEPTTIYVLSPGLEEKRPATLGTAGKVAATMLIDITAAQRFYPSSENPFDGPGDYRPPDPNRVTVQSRLARDVEKALLQDQADGAATGLGLAEVTDIQVEAVDRTAENTWEEGWAMVFLRARILYHHSVSTP